MVLIRQPFLTILCHLLLLIPTTTPNKIEIIQERFKKSTSKKIFDDDEVSVMQWIEFNIGKEWKNKKFEISSRVQVRRLDKAVRDQKNKEFELVYGPCILPRQNSL